MSSFRPAPEIGSDPARFCRALAAAYSQAAAAAGHTAQIMHLAQLNFFAIKEGRRARSTRPPNRYLSKGLKERFGPRNHRSVSRDFVVFDRLRGADDRRVQHFLIGDVAADLIGFFDQAVDGPAVYARGGLAEPLKHLIEPSDGRQEIVDGGGTQGLGRKTAS